MKATPKHRGIVYGIMHRAHCEKCAADCKDGLDGWILDGLCEDCRRKHQQKVAGR